MKSSMIKTTVREIRESLGRYMAILAIVALGVGFFVGLKVTRPAMLDTAGRYLEEKELYDLRLISTLGFDETDVEQAARQERERSVSISWQWRRTAWKRFCARTPYSACRTRRR